MRLMGTMNPSSTKSGVLGRLDTLSSMRSMLFIDLVPSDWSPRIWKSGSALGSEPVLLFSMTLKLGSKNCNPLRMFVGLIFRSASPLTST